MSGENCDSFGLTHHQEKLVSQVLELNWYEFQNFIASLLTVLPL